MSIGLLESLFLLGAWAITPLALRLLPDSKPLALARKLQPVAALLGSIARAGVYPIQITLRDSHGEETASTATCTSTPPASRSCVVWFTHTCVSIPHTSA